MDGQKNGKTFQIDSYKTNGNFTTVSIGFLSNGQRTTGEALILKKVNGSWVAVYAGQNLQPEVQKEFGIPNN
jgi:hypothetical protein